MLSHRRASIRCLYHPHLAATMRQSAPSPLYLHPGGFRYCLHRRRLPGAPGLVFPRSARCALCSWLLLAPAPGCSAGKRQAARSDEKPRSASFGARVIPLHAASHELKREWRPKRFSATVWSRLWGSLYVLIFNTYTHRSSLGRRRVRVWASDTSHTPKRWRQRLRREPVRPRSAANRKCRWR